MQTYEALSEKNGTRYHGRTKNGGHQGTPLRPQGKPREAFLDGRLVSYRADRAGVRRQQTLVRRHGTSWRTSTVGTRGHLTNRELGRILTKKMARLLKKFKFFADSTEAGFASAFT